MGIKTDELLRAVFLDGPLAGKGCKVYGAAPGTDFRYYLCAKESDNDYLYTYKPSVIPGIYILASRSIIARLSIDMDSKLFFDTADWTMEVSRSLFTLNPEKES